jgi:signal transduction histidine kinase
MVSLQPDRAGTPGREVGDPVVQLTLAATDARNPHDLWQNAAVILRRTSGGSYVRIDYAASGSSGSVSDGAAPSEGVSSLSLRTDLGHVDVLVCPSTRSLNDLDLNSFIEAACALADLVARRMRLEHERRLGTFIVELSRWMLTASTDPVTLLRYTLDSMLQLADGDGAVVVLAPAEDDGLEVVAAAGCLSEPDEPALQLLAPGVGQVVREGAPFLTSGDVGVPEEPTRAALGDTVGAAMFVPLRSTERVVGALCMVRQAHRATSEPFSLTDVSYVEAVASHVAGGLELARAIGAARQAAAQAGAMVDGTPVPLVLISDDGVVLRANDAFLRLVAREGVESVDGCSVTQFDLAVNGGCWDDALASAQSGIPWRSRVEVARGAERRYCEALVTPLPESEHAGLLLALHDRTEELRAQRELVTREKLATVGEIASGVAHEVNNPLATIRLEAELLGGAAVDPETARTVTTILREVDRAARIAKGLLRLSRQSMSVERTVKLNELLDGVVDIRSRIASKHGIDLTADLDRNVPDTIDGNSGDLQQVFVNLITNAEHAVAHSETKRILVTSVAHAGYVRIEVSDSGPGVDPDLRSRVFDPFFTTKDPDVGTGLGLALSQRIVTDHGGRISAEDGPLGGARFVVELPTERG